MIKLVVSDLDGTLLDDKKILRQEAVDCIRKLRKKGIYFAAASGRQLRSLQRVFHEIENDVIFIAEDGTYVFYQGQEIFADRMDKRLAEDVIDFTKELKETWAFVCEKDWAYTDSQRVFDVMRKVYHYDIRLTNDLKSRCDGLLKISLYDELGVEKNSYQKVAARFSQKSDMAISGDHFVDLMNPGSNKGKAIEFIKKRFGIMKHEAAAFGDNFNDVEMFDQVGFSFAMANASPAIQKRARFLAPSNNENGVVRKINELCFSSVEEY